MTEEYVRTCLIAHESLPKDVVHPGWGQPGAYGIPLCHEALRLTSIPPQAALTKASTSAARCLIPSLDSVRPSFPVHSPRLPHISPFLRFASSPTDPLSSSPTSLTSAPRFFSTKTQTTQLLPSPDALARVVIPALPPLRPHTRMLHHFRFLLPLLTNPREPSIRVGPDGAVEYGEVGEEELVTALHWYDAAVQVRCCLVLLGRRRRRVG